MYTHFKLRRGKPVGDTVAPWKKVCLSWVVVSLHELGHLHSVFVFFAVQFNRGRHVDFVTEKWGEWNNDIVNRISCFRALKSFISLLCE